MSKGHTTPHRCLDRIFEVGVGAPTRDDGAEGRVTGVDGGRDGQDDDDQPFLKKEFFVQSFVY